MVELAKALALEERTSGQLVVLLDEPTSVLERADIVQTAIATVLQGVAENDRFNELVVTAGLDPQATVLHRAVGERDPRRDQARLRQFPIIAVLVPGDEGLPRPLEEDLSYREFS